MDGETPPNPMFDPQTAAVMQPGAPVMPPSGPTAPGQMDPALIRRFLAAQMQDPQMMQAKRQMALADRLRAGAATMGKSQSPINTPNWAGTLAGVLGSYAARRLDQRADKTLADLGQQELDAGVGYMQ